MATDLQIQCRCGAFRARVRDASAENGNHGMCYCHDCQAFAHFLGHPNDILDSHGGTEVFQTSPARFEVAAGGDRLACMQLTDKGLVRWYASCCRTPIGNTLATPGMPFIGVIAACIQRPADDPSFTRTLGPIRASVFRRSAHGDRATMPPPTGSMLGMTLRFMGFMLRWRLRGDHKRSPLFDPATAKPISTPHIISTAERAALHKAVTQS